MINDFRTMNKLIFSLIIILSFTACTTISKINQVEDKWGPPAKIEELNGKKKYYWYFYESGASVFGSGNFLVGRSHGGWIVCEFTVDEKGTIIHKRKYWKQPEAN